LSLANAPQALRILTLKRMANTFAICQFASANWQTHRIRQGRMHLPFASALKAIGEMANGE